MKIAIVGSGRGGYTLAADLTLQGHAAVLCTGDRTADLEEIRSHGGIRSIGVLGGARVPVRLEADPARAVADADLVAIPVPGTVQEMYLRLVLPHLGRGQALWLCQGGGASLLPIARQRAAELLLIETMYIPYSTRRTGPAQITVRERLRVPYAAFPACRSDEAGALLRHCFDLPRARNVLEVALQNVNSMIHPLPCLLNWGDIERSEHAFAVMRDVTAGVLRGMEAIDAERVSVCEAVGVSAISVDEIYALLGLIPAPHRRPPGTNTGEAYEDRFIQEAVPVGLVTMASAARALGVATPLIESTISVCDALYATDSWKTGRTLGALGLAGLDRDGLTRVLDQGP